MNSGKLKEIIDQLEQGIKELMESDKYKEWLNVISCFHNYSNRNTILIALQNPYATKVAGYAAWKKMNRNVKKGEKGIKIIAPCPVKVVKESQVFDAMGKPKLDEDGKPIITKKEGQIMYFKPVSVFDISQTEGDELPVIAKDITGDVENFEAFSAALESVSPVPIIFKEIPGEANGYYDSRTQMIAIKKNMSERQTVKTMIHEITHSKLHKDKKDDKDKNTKEIEAESVAYTVCKHYGLDTSEYSFGYVASWSKEKEMEELKNSLETIRNTASDIITDVDKYFKEISKTRNEEQEQSKKINKEKEVALMQPKRKSKTR